MEREEEVERHEQQGQHAPEQEHEQGGPVQVEPKKPVLKAPGTMRLKLSYDGLLSKFTFKFNMRRYIKGNNNKDPFKD